MATDFGTKMLMQDFQKVYLFIFFSLPYTVLCHLSLKRKKKKIKNKK